MQAASLLPAQRRTRTGTGREECAEFREWGACRQDMRLYLPCQDASARTCSAFFFFFFKASYHPALTSFTPPLQNKTPPAWPMKKTLVTKRHDTLLWPVTLFQYWVNCFVLLFIILFTSTYKHHQLCKFPLLCLCQACPAQLLIGGKDAQACRTQHAQHVA